MVAEFDTIAEARRSGVGADAILMAAQDAAADDPLSPEALTPREVQVLELVGEGLPNKSIARHMGIEEGTVRKDYLPRLFRLFKVVRRTELLVEVSRRGIVVPPPQPSEGTET